MKTNKTVNICIIIIIILTVSCLLLLYLYNSGSIVDLLKDIIPSILSALFISITVIFFNVFGIKLSFKNEEAFVNSFQSVDWGEALKGAKKMDLVVLHLDNWTSRYRDNIIDFLEHGGKIRIILMNKNSKYINIAAERLCKTKKVFILKIERTIENLKRDAKLAKASEDALQIYYYDDLINYPIMKIDNKTGFSVFAHFNDSVVQSPFLNPLSNLSNTIVNDFIDREIEELIKKSTKMDN